jgi:hypothetical protein
MKNTREKRISLAGLLSGKETQIPFKSFQVKSAAIKASRARVVSVRRTAEIMRENCKVTVETLEADLADW